jgi:3'-5' exoribonuclease
MSEQQQPEAPKREPENETGANGATDTAEAGAESPPDSSEPESSEPESSEPESSEPESSEPESSEPESSEPESSEPESSEPESAESEAPEASTSDETAPADETAPSEETAPAAETAEAPAPAEAAARAEAGHVQVRKRAKSVYASEVKAGQSVEGIFLVQSKELPVDRNGKRYLSVTLADRTGRIDARLWEGAEVAAETFRQSDHVRVRGLAQSYHGRTQLRLDTIEAVDAGAEGLPASEFVAESKKPVDRMLADLVAVVDGMQNAHLKALVHAFLDDPDHANRFKRAPAAQSIHHAWKGGLLEHTLSVMQLCERLCDHYPHVDRDLVLAGAFFHDYGKIDELAYEDTVGYTDEGRLVGHLVMCCQWLRERAGELDGFPKPLLDQLVHIVVSHHGELEYGSPRRPQTLEALLVHSADVLDARVSSWTELLEGAGPDGWTDFVRVYDRQLFRGGATIEGGAPAGVARKKRRKRRKRKPAGEGAEAAPTTERRGGPPKRTRPAGGAAPEGARRGRPDRRERPPRPDRPERGRGAKERPKREEKPTLTFNPFAALAKKDEEGGAAEAAEKTPRAPDDKAPDGQES